MAKKKKSTGFSLDELENELNAPTKEEEIEKNNDNEISIEHNEETVNTVPAINSDNTKNSVDTKTDKSSIKKRKNSLMAKLEDKASRKNKEYTTIRISKEHNQRLNIISTVRLKKNLSKEKILEQILDEILPKLEN